MDFEELTVILNEAKAAGKDPVMLVNEKIQECDTLLSGYRKIKKVLEFAAGKKTPTVSSETRGQDLSRDRETSRLKVASYLKEHGTIKSKEIAKLAEVTATSVARLMNHPWFNRVSHGVYELSQNGIAALA